MEALALLVLGFGDGRLRRHRRRRRGLRPRTRAGPVLRRGPHHGGGDLRGAGGPKFALRHGRVPPAGSHRLPERPAVRSRRLPGAVAAPFVPPLGPRRYVQSPAWRACCWRWRLTWCCVPALPGYPTVEHEPPVRAVSSARRADRDAPRSQVRLSVQRGDGHIVQPPVGIHLQLLWYRGRLHPDADSRPTSSDSPCWWRWRPPYSPSPCTPRPAPSATPSRETSTGIQRSYGPAQDS